MKTSLVACSISALAALAAPVAHHAANATAPIVSEGPSSAVRSLAAAYSRRSVEALAALLSDDYRFHAVGDRLADGFTRQQELEAAVGLFQGTIHDRGDKGVVVSPRADSITMTLEGLLESPDPEHPDSTEHYRLVTVRRFELHAQLSDGWGLGVIRGAHVFCAVRGDAAVLAAGQLGGKERWYIQRWVEDLDAVASALGREKGHCDQPLARDTSRGLSEPQDTGTLVPLALAIHLLGNPACPTLEILCDLPGGEPARVEVFDVSGRRVTQRELAAPRPGTLKLEAGAGTRLSPGVYWVRLTQAARRPSTKMVVVAR